MKIKLFAKIVTVAMISFVIVSCMDLVSDDIKKRIRGADLDNSTHTHTFSDEWKSDKTYHWHAATCEHTDEVSGKVEDTWNEGKVTKEATEENDGEKTFTCKICLATKTKAIPALGHSHTIATTWKSDETYHWHEASCGKEEHNTDKEIHSSSSWKNDGDNHWKICDDCGTKFSEAKHTWNEGVVTTVATEEVDGEKTFTCTVCGKIKIEVIPALGHSHTIATTWSSDETYHWHEASCGKEEHNTDKEIHSSSSWKNDGDNHWKICDDCSAKFSEEEHTFSDTWESDDTNHWHECECGAKKDEAEHEWDVGVVTTPPTTSSDGVKTFTCTVCLATKTQVIHKLGNNKVIDGVECQKTEELEICTESTTIAITDDSSWSEYYSGSDSQYKGVFIKDRNVTLSPFSMGKYEVTQELYTAVMGDDPSWFGNPESGETQELRPVERVSWYHAIAFCNKLSIIEGLEPCYSVKIDGEEVDWANLAHDSIPTDTTWDAATCDFTKKGYRLPTEAEWEYAARGGKDSETWKYTYAGSNTKNKPKELFSIYLAYADDALEEYAWYNYNSFETHEVGLKKPNSLGLYDMSGNVWEWCWDWSDTVSAETVIDPTGPTSGSDRLERGGGWDLSALYCAVSRRYGSYPYGRISDYGFRLARSL